MKIIENFLDDQEFKDIHHNLLNIDLPWYFNERCLTADSPIENQHYQFTHLFFTEHKTRQFYQLVEPLVNKINPSSIHRIKANCNPKTEKIIETGMHEDTFDNRYTSSVFFINDNDGYCKIGNEKIYSKANRLVTFNSTTRHTGTTCTNTIRRVLINLVYIANL
tara:strand:- start:98 stop:589 length:492 start_codon:yes stop_codon:yes gene_type:complete